MADSQQKQADRKRRREMADSSSDSADAAASGTQKKKKSEKDVAPAYTAMDVLKVCPLDPLKSIVESVLLNEATRAVMEEQLLAASSRVGKQVAADIITNVAEMNKKLRADCTTETRKRKVQAIWPAELEPYLDQIRSQLLEGPFAEGPKLAWQTLIQVMTMCVKEWEQGEEPDWEEEIIETFHESVDELMCAIWWAQNKKAEKEGSRDLHTWDWLRHTDRRDEVVNLQNASAWYDEPRYTGICELMEDDPEFSPEYHSQAPLRTTYVH